MIILIRNLRNSLVMAKKVSLSVVTLHSANQNGASSSKANRKVAG